MQQSFIKFDFRAKVPFLCHKLKFLQQFYEHIITINKKWISNKQAETDRELRFSQIRKMYLLSSPIHGSPGLSGTFGKTADKYKIKLHN